MAICIKALRLSPARPPNIPGLGTPSIAIRVICHYVKGCEIVAAKARLWGEAERLAVGAPVSQLPVVKWQSRGSYVDRSILRTTLDQGSLSFQTSAGSSSEVNLETGHCADLFKSATLRQELMATMSRSWRRPYWIHRDAALTLPYDFLWSRPVVVR